MTSTPGRPKGRFTQHRRLETITRLFEQTPRQQSPKHLALATLRLRSPGVRWPELRRRWNAALPEAIYDDPHHRMFRRDVNDAVRRFTNA